jgi:two-component system, LuxR family, sensor kinase FixL
MSQPDIDKAFKDIFDNTSDFIHYVTPEGEIELVNSTWLNTLGYIFEEVKGKSIYNFIHPDFLEAYKITRRNVITKNVTEIVETAFISKRGGIIFGHGQIACTFKDGKVEHTRCVFKNITEGRLIEKQLIENEKRLRTFFTAAPDAVVVIDQEQNITDWNPKAEAVFGFEAKEVIGKPLSEIIIPPQYREAHKKGFAHFLATGQGPVLNKTIEISALHKNGNEFYIDLSISNVMLEHEWVFIAFITDITEKKKTEQTLIHKEAELLQSKLLQDKQDEFISIASHELKTPLTTIKAFTQMASAASKTGNSEMVKNYLVKAEQHIRRLSYLMTELLDVSRIHAGKMILSKEETDMSVFLPDALNMIELISPNHTVILEKNESGKVLIDAMRIEQVITNLVSNATKYSPGKDKILVNSTAANGNLTISITDFGIGIPSDKINKLFTRFYRVEESTHKFTGLGIGLFISSEIIKQHGGKIWVESKEGEGSTFSFSLPLIK